MKKILLVDDDTLFLDTMVDVLSSENYEIDSSTNGMEALNKLHEKKHEIVILDYNMHPINGLELVERIRARKYDCTIIMITAFGTFELATEALAKEVFTILPKPVKMKQLRSTVKKALQSRALNQQSHILEVQRTELEKINHLLRVSRSEFQAVFDSITDPVMILDTNLNVVGANRATIDSLQLKQSEILEKPCNHLFCCGEMATCDDCPARRTLSTKLPTQEKILDSFQEKLYQVNTYPIFEDNNSNEIKSIVEFRRDITKISEMEVQIMKSENISGKINLAAEVGHELKNMFAIIKGHLGLMEIYLEDDDPQKMKRSLERTNEGMKRVLAFTNNLMGNHLKGANATTIKLIPFLNALLNFIKPQELFSSIHFQRYWRDREVILRANEIQLQQVFINLFKNAAEAMKLGSITISTDFVDDNKNIQIQVSDNGPGIPIEIMDRIFDENVTTKRNGHGYGLMITKKLVKQNKGMIEVKSESNQGTEFTLTFPNFTTPNVRNIRAVHGDD